MDDSQKAMFSRLMTDAHMNSHTQQRMQDLHRCKPGGISRPRGGSRFVVPQLPRTLQLIRASKGKISFLYWSIIEYINHTPGQTQCLGVGGQHKRNSMFGGFILFYQKLFVQFWSNWFCVSSNFIYVFCLKREDNKHKVEQVGRTWKETGQRKALSNYIVRKILKLN